MPDFFNGIELVRLYAGGKSIQTVATAVIGLIGSAPTHLVAEQGERPYGAPVLVTSEEEAARLFGPDTPGYTIPAALRSLFQNGAGTIFVNNIFDVDKHEQDPSRIVAADLLSGYDDAGRRKGIAAFIDCKSTYGIVPKQLIAPVYSGLNGVLQDIDVAAKKMRAFAWIDAPPGLAPPDTIATRSKEGIFVLGSKEIGLCYPHVKTTNAQGETVLAGISPFIAGAQAKKDLIKGFHYSVSNTELMGVTGLERPIHADIMDPACEANLLNAAGFITIFNEFGKGFRTWGNRSAAFPGNADPDNFICVHRTATIIEDSICAFSTNYHAEPITGGLIDQLLMDVNGYLNGLRGLGAVQPGAEAWYDESKNPSSSRANGVLRISYRFLPPAPLERLCYESIVDISLAGKGV